MTKYGECAKHPYNSMIDCPECSLENSIKKHDDDYSPIPLDRIKNKIAKEDGFEDWKDAEFKLGLGSLMLLVDKVCEEYSHLTRLKSDGSEAETFKDLFKQHQIFAKDRFPDSTAKSSLLGLKRECDEAIEELHGINRDYDGNALGLEYVDCMMYLLDSMERAGLSLDMFMNFFKIKLDINKQRAWKKNKDGSYSHVK